MKFVYAMLFVIANCCLVTYSFVFSFLFYHVRHYKEPCWVGCYVRYVQLQNNTGHVLHSCRSMKSLSNYFCRAHALFELPSRIIVDLLRGFFIQQKSFEQFAIKQLRFKMGILLRWRPGPRSSGPATRER